MRTDQSIINRYTVTGGVLSYSVTFPLYERSDVAVYLGRPDGSESLLVLDADYSVSINDNQTGGTVVLFDNVAEAGDVLALLSAVPYTQELDLSNVATIDVEATERQMDRTTQQVQQLKEQIERSVVIPPTSSVKAEDMVRDLFNARAEAVTAADEARQAEQDVKAWPGRAKVLATGSTTPRPLQDRFADVVNVKDFGAKGNAVSDDTAAIQAALNAGATTSKTVFFPAGTYIVGSELTVTNAVPLSVFADNATLKLVCAKSIARMFRINPSADVRIEGLALDVNRNAYIGLSIRKDDKTAIADLDLVRVRVENVYRAGTEFSGGDGIAVTGEFRNVNVISPVIRNCVCAAGSIIAGSQGIFGLTFSRLSNDDTAGASSDNVYIENPVIENIYTEDATEGRDQDAIRVFSNYKITSKQANPDTFTLVGGLIRNVRGRAVKGQTHSCSIDGLTVVYDTDPAGFTGIMPNKATIEMQVGGGNISNITVFANGYMCKRVISMVYENFAVTQNAAGNISNIRVSTSRIKVTTMRENETSIIGITSYNTVSVGPLVTNISNVTASSDSFFFNGVSINTGSLAEQEVSAHILNFEAPVSNAILNVAAGGLSNNVLAHSRSKGESSPAAFATSYPDKHTCTIFDVDGVGNIQTSVLPQKLLVSRSGVAQDAYQPKSVDALVVTAQNGTAELVVVGSGDEGVGRIQLGTRDIPASARFSTPISSMGGLNLAIHNGTATEGLVSWEVTRYRPTTDGVISLGSSSYRWSQLYAATTEIGTSDEREKANIASVDEALMRAWGKVDFKAFQFIDAIEKKGAEARVHVGVIAQQVAEAFASEGLDASRYALFCHDKWEEQPAKYDHETGEEIVPYRPAGDRYGIRYSEALALECAYQRWRLDKLEAKLNG